jgi:phosphoribosylaminoimidazole carboxylase PurE protein
MSVGKAVIMMGSKVDLDHAMKIVEWLDRFGIAYELRIASAHKTPEKVLEIIAEHENESGNIVYITIAGLSNALSGTVDFSTVHPVIACPPPCDSFGGADVYSSLRMPPGVAPALILDPRNAALFAAKLFALGDSGLRSQIRAQRAAQRAKIDEDEKTL